MKRISLLLCWVILLQSPLLAQQYVESLDLESLAPNRIHKLWLKMIDNGLSQPVYIPVLIAKGRQLHPVVGLTAAIHGNELNGIPIIQQLFEGLDPASLNGTILAVPGLNAISLPLHERRFVDEEDLNRLFPGKEDGNRSQQYAWQIKEKLLPHIDYLVDMHTASFGRVNTLYVRADLDDFKISQMAGWLDA
ncbi:MAG: succinylglutamate desuccinylase/aspartoacylase family protein, partial [Phaeodactylibacter sp.]|nr:succinylglutamate desuccinylase/aspartoacylase family protein [Phaeodactylibacter sp.]